MVDEIYKTDIKGSNYSIKRIMMLEFSQYLENYLWKNYDVSVEIYFYLESFLWNWIPKKPVQKLLDAVRRKKSVALFIF